MRKALILALAATMSAGFVSVHANAVIGLDPALKEQISARPKGVHRVIVFLKHQPGPQIGQAVREVYEPQIDLLSNELRAITILSRPSASLNSKGEIQPSRNLISQEGGNVVLAINHQIDDLRNAMVAEIVRQIRPAIEPSQDEVSLLIGRLGGTVVERLVVMNVVVADMPASAIDDLANDGRIAIVAANNFGAPELDVSTASIFAPSFWSAGFTGGALDVGVLDTGVQQNHAAFAGKVFESNAGITDSNGHGTSMAGIMAGNPAASPNLRGVAWGADAISVATAGADATSMTGMNYLVTGPVQKAEAINYSFGNGTANVNDYAPIDQFFDGVISTFGIMVSKSTGNGGFGTGTPTITHPAPAFNLLASANIDDFNTTSRLNDRISSSSSRGPTVSGRKKPDITSPGTNINSPNRTGTYTAVTGTSPASPHTGASVVLLMSRGVVNQLAAKAILLNNTDAMNDNDTAGTADDTFVNGSFWNRRYGWGYINLQKSLLHAPDYFLSNFAPPATGQRLFRLYRGQMFQFEKATLTWNRQVTYGGAAYPTAVEGLSNLDLACYLQSTNGLHASSVSTIDNVEQLSVNADGTYVLKVYTVGTFDPQVSSQQFALATEENFVAATGPVLAVTVTQLEESYPGGSVRIRVTLRNTGDLPAFSSQFAMNGATVLDGPNSISAGTLNPTQTVSHTFRVRVPSTPGLYPLNVAATSTSYGENFTGNGTMNLISQ